MALIFSQIGQPLPPGGGGHRRRRIFLKIGRPLSPRGMESSIYQFPIAFFHGIVTVLVLVPR